MEHRRRPVARTGRRHVPRLAILASVGGVAAIAAVLTLGLSRIAIAAAPSGGPGATVTAKIAVRFKSVTISTARLTYGSCTGGSSSAGSLGFPNGRCTTARVKVTNGSVPSTILVAGTNAIPSDRGQHWAICGGLGAPSCSVTKPGVNQFSEQDTAVHLGLKGACDLNFARSPCGAAQAHQTASEALALYGPKSSTDRSPTFTTEITWTAS